jgi:hypothetical protein
MRAPLCVAVTGIAVRGNIGERDGANAGAAPEIVGAMDIGESDEANAGAAPEVVGAMDIGESDEDNALADGIGNPAGI